tara:strand:+ start:153 stop:368 length:216 start_codon:yes stop_codon:yes gene_type:complete
MNKYSPRGDYTLIITGDNFKALNKLALKYRTMKSYKLGYYSEIFENEFLAKSSKNRESALVEARTMMPNNK